MTATLKNILSSQFTLLAFTCIASTGCDEKILWEAFPGTVPRGDGYQHINVVDPPGGGRIPGMVPVPLAEPYSPTIPPGCSSPQQSPVASCTWTFLPPPPPPPPMDVCSKPGLQLHYGDCFDFAPAN